MIRCHFFLFLGFLALFATAACKPFFNDEPKPAKSRRLRMKAFHTRTRTLEDLENLPLEKLVAQRVPKRPSRSLGLLSMFDSKEKKEAKAIEAEMAQIRRKLAFFQPEHDLGNFLNEEATLIKAELTRIIDRFGDLDEQIEATMGDGYNELVRMAAG